MGCAVDWMEGFFVQWSMMAHLAVFRDVLPGLARVSIDFFNQILRRYLVIGTQETDLWRSIDLMAYFMI